MWNNCAGMMMMKRERETEGERVEVMDDARRMWKEGQRKLMMDLITA